MLISTLDASGYAFTITNLINLQCTRNLEHRTKIIAVLKGSNPVE